MNAPHHDPHAPSRPTQTVWPGARRSDPPQAPRTHDTSREDRKDDDHTHDEPGYGHGV